MSAAAAVHLTREQERGSALARSEDGRERENDCLHSRLAVLLTIESEPLIPSDQREASDSFVKTSDHWRSQTRSAAVVEWISLTLFPKLMRESLERQIRGRDIETDYRQQDERECGSHGQEPSFLMQRYIVLGKRLLLDASE